MELVVRLSVLLGIMEVLMATKGIEALLQLVELELTLTNLEQMLQRPQATAEFHLIGAVAANLQLQVPQLHPQRIEVAGCLQAMHKAGVSLPLQQSGEITMIHTL